MLVLILMLIIFLFVAIYFIPSFIAIGRKHAHVMQITLLNTFLGWSFVAWVAALIWASTNYIEKSVKTKGAWIIIGTVFVLAMLPVVTFSTFSPKYQTSIFQETQYKSVVYKTKTGKLIKQVTESKHSVR